MIRLFLLCSSLLSYSNIVIADNQKLSLPRFASIKSNEVNVRTGPAIKCPIEWVFVRKGEPVEIIAEFEQWRQIRDIQGEGGWVHVSVLSGKRSVIITGKEIIPLLAARDNDSKMVARVSPEVRCQLSKCQQEWCKVRCQGHTGWLMKKNLWGVYKDTKNW